jgi:glycosyltransferase involved in cell wall biosynthesis
VKASRAHGSARRLLVVTGNFGGGTGAHMVGLLRHLDPARWQAEIVCQARRELAPPPGVLLVEARLAGGLNRFPIAQLRQLVRLRRHVRSRRPAVVHTYFFWPIMLGRLLKRTGAIRHLVENREDQGFNLGEWEYRLLRATRHVPDRIICVSEAVQRIVVERERVEPGRTTVIHNGIELPPETARARDGAAVRKELGLAAHDLVVGMVANLNRPVKGGAYFIESLPLILERVPRARFLIAGGGDVGRLRARAEELRVADRVIFGGFRTDLERIYPAMDVSVLTSLSEGLSMTLLESMSHGLPVVATRVGGNPEIVRDGETGYLVPARDPAAFAARVVELLCNAERRRDMGRAGRAVVARDFSLIGTAARYQAVYDGLVGADAVSAVG